MKCFTGTLNGRPVEFAVSMWTWIYSDTPLEAAVEKVDWYLVRKIKA